MIGAGKKRNGLYYPKFGAGGKVFSATNLRDCDLWHQRLGHRSLGSLSSLSTNFGFKLNKSLDECCDVCHCAKQTRSPFSLSNTKAQCPFSLIHCDLRGPYHTRSLSGCYYFLCAVDDYSHAIWVYLLKDKTETYDKLISFCSMVKTQFDIGSKGA